MAGADISAESEKEPDASGQLAEIANKLSDQRSQALTYLDGIRVLESLVDLFQKGRLTSEDLSKLSELIKARSKSPNGALTGVSDSTESSLTNFSLPPVRLTRFEEWRGKMKPLDDLAKKYEGLLTSSRFIFSYPRVSVQPAPGFDNGSRSPKLRLSSVPIFDTLQSEDPISELFGKSPLNPETYKPRLDTGAFAAVISVPDYRNANSVEENRDTVELKNGTSSQKLKLPENHLLLAVLLYDPVNHHYILDSGDNRRYLIEDGISTHKIVDRDAIDWSAIADNLSVKFKQADSEDEKNIRIEKSYTSGKIILGQMSPEEPLPSPYKILARCLDAIAEIHPPEKEKGKWLLSTPGRQTNQRNNHIERPEVWEVSAAIEQFRNDNQLDQLFEALEAGKTGHLLHEHLSLSTSIWLYRTVELMEGRVRRDIIPFFDFARTMKDIDKIYPVSPHQTWQPFVDFHKEVARIRVDECYVNQDVLRRKETQAALEKLIVAINDTL